MIGSTMVERLLMGSEVEDYPSVVSWSFLGQKGNSSLAFTREAHLRSK
jgi:hypothetical protein